jgi:hypothetical protein
MIMVVLCVNFLDARRDDVYDWQSFSNAVNNVGSARKATELLLLGRWLGAGFDCSGVQ